MAILFSGDSGGSFYTYKNKKPVILGVVSVGISGTTEKICNDQTFALIVDVTKFTEWIKRAVGGNDFLTADEVPKEPVDSRGMMWDDKSAFCEFKENGG
jgi:secreted trypsin-like serine protease